MTFIQMLIIGVMAAFIIPFFVYLFHRLQMTAWLNALDTWLKNKANEKEEEEED